MRCVSGGRWTRDGRWVVVGTWRSSWGTFPDVILYDPDNGDPFLDIRDCHEWMRDHADDRR